MQTSGAQGGKVFADRYRRLGRLGTGGMATVYLARDELLGREVAIKRLHSAAPDDLQKRFRREARLGAALNHPNIVAIFDSVTDEDSLYIVMEYVKGEALDARIDRGPIEPSQALAILEQSAAAIDYAHSEDVVHRDIKPSNLLVREDGVVKVADLGIATAADMSQITKSGSVMGTLPYIAPERLRGDETGPPSDVYSLAAVAYEMLAGRRAIEPRTPEDAVRLATEQSAPDLRDAWPGAPPEAAEIICEAMAAEPANRPGSATELIDGLERALGQTGSSKAELAAATVPMAIVPYPEVEADAEDDPTAEQELAEDPLPPPPPRPERSQRPARAEPPEPPLRAPAPVAAADPPRKSRSVSGAAVLALAACIAVAVAIGLAVTGGDDGESGTQAAQRQAGDGGGQGSADRGGDAAPAEPAPEPDPATEPEPDPEPEPVDTGSEEEVPGVGTGVIDPGQGAAINDEGFGILQAGDPAGALPYFQRAITYFPSGSTDTNYSFTLYNLGDALTRLGRGEEAIPYLELRLERWDDRDDQVAATLAEARAQAAE